MATITLPVQGNVPWDAVLNTAINAINSQVENHETRIVALEAGGGGGGAPAWSAITGKPSTFPPTIGSGAADAVAGNDARLTNQRTPSDNSVTSAKIVDGAIVNADINASAAIAQSKIASLTTDLAAKAPLASPTFTGTVAVPSPAAGDNTTKPAPTAWVQSTLSNYIVPLATGAPIPVGTNVPAIIVRTA